MASPNTEMTTYTYLYNCSRWWGRVSGVRNITHEGSDTEVIDAAVKEAKRVSGSETCDISLLQKFKITLTLAEPYTALVQFPLSGEKEPK